MRPFTLMELLIVIMIIAVLASMLLPALKVARDTALRIPCLGNVKQLGMAYRMYADDNNDEPIAYSYAIMKDLRTENAKIKNSWYLAGKYKGPQGPWNNGVWDFRLAWTYFNADGKVFQCPNDQLLKTGKAYGLLANHSYYGGWGLGPSAYDAGAHCYAHSYMISTGQNTLQGVNSVYPGIKMSQAKNPSKLMAVSDILTHYPHNYIHDDSNDARNFYSKILSNPYMRHTSGGNISHMDGSARFYSRDEMLKNVRYLFLRNP